MHRVLASLALAVLLALSAALQVSAAGPAASSPPDNSTTAGGLDATDRYIVMLRKGADTTAVVDKASKRDGVKADRKFSKAVHGFSAKLDPKQKADLMPTRTSWRSSPTRSSTWPPRPCRRVSHGSSAS